MIAEHVPYCYSFTISDFQGKLLHEEVLAGKYAHIKILFKDKQKHELKCLNGVSKIAVKNRLHFVM